MNRNKNKKERKLLLLLLLVVFIGIGYATLSSNLNINGTSTITDEEWDVHFTNLASIDKKGLATDEGDGLSAATINASDNKVVDFNIKMRQPKDKYSFTVDVKNFGTLPAKANLEVTGLDSAMSEYITWSVSGLEADETIDPQESKTLTVTVEYKDLDHLPSEGFTANLKAKVTATQK